MINTISALIMAFGISCAGYLIGHGYIDAHYPHRTVEVKGLAEKKVRADQAQWQIRYKVVNQKLSGLYNKLESSETIIKNFLKTQGFVETEITVEPQNINDNQANSYNANNNAPRYTADGSIAVFTINVDKILVSSQKVGTLVKNGVVITGTNTQFRYTKLNSIKPEMLLTATTNATKAGQTFAKQSKSKLGPIKTARQGLFTITDLNSNYNSNNDVNKKVRVVSTITFVLK